MVAGAFRRPLGPVDRRQRRKPLGLPSTFRKRSPPAPRRHRTFGGGLVLRVTLWPRCRATAVAEHWLSGSLLGGFEMLWRHALPVPLAKPLMNARASASRFCMCAGFFFCALAFTCVAAFEMLWRHALPVPLAKPLMNSAGLSFQILRVRRILLLCFRFSLCCSFCASWEAAEHRSALHGQDFE